MNDDQSRPAENEQPAPPPPDVEEPKQRTPQEQAALRHQLRRKVEEQMKKQGLRGNPRDFAIMRDQDTIITAVGVYKIGARLPDKLDKSFVYIFNRDNKLRPVQVLEDRGKELLVTTGSAVSVVEREECFPTPIPREPQAVHRRELGNFIGKVVKSFWHAATSRPREP